MTDKNVYQVPQADLLTEKPNVPRQDGTVLRMALLILFGVYAFFTIAFCLIGLLSFLHGVTTKHILNMVNTILMAFFSIKAFICIKRRELRAYFYVLALFFVGFAVTVIYGQIYRTPHHIKADIGNLVLFGIPVVFTYAYWRRLKTPDKNIANTLGAMVPALIVFTLSGLLIFKTYHDYILRDDGARVSQSRPAPSYVVPAPVSHHLASTKTPSTPAPAAPEQAHQRNMLVPSSSNPADASYCHGVKHSQYSPRRHYIRKVVGFLPRERALEMIRNTERHTGERISPRFVRNQRVVLTTLSGFARRNIIALIPEGMTVNMGDIVEFTTGGNFDPKYPCNYVPNLIDKVVRTAREKQRY